MHVQLILVAYDSGHPRLRMGAGPEVLAPAVRQLLQERRHRVSSSMVEADAGWHAEIATTFQLARGVARQVRSARASDRFPLVLSGNCGVSIGVTAAFDGDVSVTWLDAHGDFNTPDTTVGGFLDGMTLATLTGRCWPQLAGSVAGFTPVAEDRVWLVGARDLDPLEQAALDESRVRRAPADRIGAELAREVAATCPAPHYLHVDLDVLDAAAAKVNSYAAEGGASPAALADFCTGLRAAAPPAAVTVSAYDPAADHDGRGREAALAALAALF